MELRFITKTPINLKTSILKLIEVGDLKTWKIDTSDDKQHIFHTSQWGEKGVIEMEVDTIQKQLLARVIPYHHSVEIIQDFEGYYLGRFCEILFVNFPNSFISILKS